MTFKPRRTWIASAIAISLALSACGGGGSGAASDEPISLGFISIFSGRVAMLGNTGYQGAQLAVEEINSDGGVLGDRKLEIAKKDTGANPEQAVRAARDFVLQDEVDFLVDGSSSNEAFAVSQAAPQLETVVITTGSEADSFTEEKNLQDKVFRVARSTWLDGIANAQYGKTLKHRKWMSISPDYAYGRDCTNRYFEALKDEQPDVEVGTQLWPALFEPDYTPLIQQIRQNKPDALYSCLWGGDLVAFVRQAKSFGLFDDVDLVTPNLADSLVLESLGDKLPAGIHTGSRFALGSPATEANEKFDSAYRAKYDEGPTNWSVESYLGVRMLAEAIEKAGSTDPDEVAKALEGLELANSPWGDVKLRADDHTLIRYDVSWGISDPAREEYPVAFDFRADWDKILEKQGSGS